MSDDNGKPNGQELGITSKGNLAPAALIKGALKPGYDARRGIGRKAKKKKTLGFVDYLAAHYDEEVEDTRPGHEGEMIPRAQKLAIVIGNAALGSECPALQKECMKIVLENLWPKPKDPSTFIQINEYHSPQAIAFKKYVDEQAQGQKPDGPFMMDCFRRFTGPDGMVVSECYHEDEEDGT